MNNRLKLSDDPPDYTRSEVVLNETFDGGVSDGLYAVDTFSEVDPTYHIVYAHDAGGGGYPDYLCYTDFPEYAGSFTIYNGEAYYLQKDGLILDAGYPYHIRFNYYGNLFDQYPDLNGDWEDITALFVQLRDSNMLFSENINEWNTDPACMEDMWPPYMVPSNLFEMFDYIASDESYFRMGFRSVQTQSLVSSYIPKIITNWDNFLIEKWGSNIVCTNITKIGEWYGGVPSEMRLTFKNVGVAPLQVGENFHIKIWPNGSDAHSFNREIIVDTDVLSDSIFVVNIPFTPPNDGDYWFYVDVDVFNNVNELGEELDITSDDVRFTSNIIEITTNKIKWTSPDENEFILFGIGDAIFNFSYEFSGIIDNIELSLNEINYGTVWDGTTNPKSILLSYRIEIDGEVNATLHGYYEGIEIVNEIRTFTFGKKIIDAYELIARNTTFIGNQLYVILHDPSGDNSYSSFSSGSTMSIGVGCNVENDTQYDYHVGVDYSFMGIGMGASMDFQDKETLATGFDFRYEVSTMDSVSSSKQKLNPDYIGPGYGDIYWGEAWVFTWQLNARNVTYFNGTSKHIDPEIKYGINRSAEVFLSDNNPSLPQEWQNENIVHNEYNGVSFFRNILLEGSTEIIHTDCISETQTREKSFTIYSSDAAKLGFFLTGKKTVTITTKNYEEVSEGQWVEMKYYLLDDEGEDRIYMDIGMDPLFGTYIFKTNFVETQTSNPLEHGTYDYIPPYVDFPSIDYDSNNDGIGPCQDDIPFVTVDISDEAGIQLVLIYFSINNGENWDSAFLTEQIANPGTWYGSIPSYEHGISVLWYIEAWDNTGHKTLRKDEYDQNYAYTVLNRVPTVLILYPNGNEVLERIEVINWSYNDPDGDTPEFTLSYNIENMGWHEIINGLKNSSYLWNISALPDSNSVNLMISAVDGYGGGNSDESDFSFKINNLAPTGTISINNGEEYTSTLDIVLGINVFDGNGISQMRFSMDGIYWSNWENYTTSKLFTLSGGDGKKIIYAQFKDYAGSVSIILIDEINLKTKDNNETLSLVLIFGIVTPIVGIAAAILYIKRKQIFNR